VYSAHRLRNWALKHPNWVVWQQGSSRKARLAPGDIFVTSSWAGREWRQWQGWR